MVLAPLQQPRFRRYFVAQLISYLGSAATPVAISFAVLDRSHSPSALGAVNAASAAPLVLLVLFGGVLGDRMRRRTILVGTNLALAGARAAFAALILARAGSTWDLSLCAVAGGAATAFFLPTSSSVIPEVVPEDDLRQANALVRLTRNGSTVLGAALGGVAVAAIGPGWALVWDAASFVIAAGLFATISLSGGATPVTNDPTAVPPARTGVLADLRLGWSDFWSRPWLWSIVLQFAAVNAAFAAGFQLLGPVIAQRSLGGPRSWGLVLSAEAAGFVIGGLVALRWHVQRPLLVGTYGVFMFALPLLALAARAPLAVIMVGAFVTGIGVEQFGVGWSTVMHEQIPLERLSRVSSYDMLGSFVFIPVGFALGGPISAAAGVQPTVWGAAVVVVAATAAVLLCRDVRTMRAGSLPSVAVG